MLAAGRKNDFRNRLNVARSLSFVFFLPEVKIHFATGNHTYPLPDDKISDWSKLKQIADDILKCI